MSTFSFVKLKTNIFQTVRKVEQRWWWLRKHPLLQLGLFVRIGFYYLCEKDFGGTMFEGVAYFQERQLREDVLKAKVELIGEGEGGYC
jgi:hypothetical protein